jgi:uncharacterized membrane protein
MTLKDEEVSPNTNFPNPSPQESDCTTCATEISTFLPQNSSPAVEVTVNNVTSSKEGEQPPISKPWMKSRYAGLIRALVSGIAFSSTGILVKYLKGIHVLNLGLFRFMGMFLPALLFVIRSLISESPAVLFAPIWPVSDGSRLRTLVFLFARSFAGFASIFCYFLAVQRIPVSDVSVLGSLQMIAVAVLAHFTLGERCGVTPALAAVLTIGGILCIAKPPLLTGREDFDMDTLVIYFIYLMILRQIYVRHSGMSKNFGLQKCRS